MPRHKQSSWYSLPGGWECRCFSHSRLAFLWKRKDSGFEIPHNRKRLCIETLETAWAPGTMDIFQSLRCAAASRPGVLRCFNHSFYSLGLINQARCNRANAYSTFPRGETFEFCFCTSQTFLDFLFPSIRVLARSYFIICSLISISHRTERNPPPNSSETQHTW